MNMEKLLIVINEISKKIQENKEFLTDLDQVIGDGDHGLNMNKGFKAVDKALSETDIKTCDILFKTIAMALISNVGGAAGPLYGTAFLFVSKAIGPKEDIVKEDLPLIFDAFIKGVQMRGKAVQGEKTMLDSLIPAYESIEKSVKSSDNCTQLFNKACIEANNGIEYTKTIIATKGRASYLGERSIGHQDPGATSSYLMIKSILETLESGI